tara:strand:- start:9656 stop:12049 length:2394 start_codon:yes stop_codon:yes gene_type:complete
MLASYFSQRINRLIRLKINVIVSALFCLGLFAIVFTILIIQVQAGTAAYLSGLSLWSKGQIESVRKSEIYAQTGEISLLQQARFGYQVPLGDLNARQMMELEQPDYKAAVQGFLQGGNHPDDIQRMIWLFRLFQNAPYFRDAIDAWRATDQLLLKLGLVIDSLERTWQKPEVEHSELVSLRIELTQLDDKLARHAVVFRNKMNLASRALANILSVTTIIFFGLLSSIASLLIIKMIATIRSSELKYRKTFEHAAIGITQVDDEGHILEANDALCDILKYSREELFSLTYNQLIHPDDRYIGIESRIALEDGKQDSVCLMQRLYRGDGSVVWTKITMSSLEGRGSNSIRFIGIIEDVSEQQRLSEELNYQARHDDLTGLINRRAFDGYLNDALLRAKSENFIHGLCFIDLDQFKIVNDTAGHLVGDQLLQQVAKLLSGHLRKGDLLARLGGDEFGLILECCEPAESLKLAEALRQTLVEMPFLWEAKNYTIGCSVGVVPITATSGGVTELLRAADSACQMAKEQGRNRVLLAHEDDEVLAERRDQMAWVARIRDAIKNEKLFLDAQKIVSLKEDTFDRIEVLVRMKGEQDEIILPDIFLPPAERFGLAHLIDRWVIERVCKYYKACPNELNTLDACHINISGRSFDHNDFTDFTLDLLSKYQMPGCKICFEITETAAISNLMEVSKFMVGMRQAGCTFALDDFGSGLSSFAYLKQLDVEYLKIDGSFVQHLATDETDKAMVRAITDIGQTLGKIMVAEFVEDQLSLEYLTNMGVEYVQGYHLHRPETFELFLKEPVCD